MGLSRGFSFRKNITESVEIFSCHILGLIEVVSKVFGAIYKRFELPEESQIQLKQL